MSAPTVDELLPLPDAAALELAAAAFRPAGQKVVSAVAAAEKVWKGLDAPGVYDTPSTDKVLGALTVPAEVAAIVLKQCQDVAKALDAYATNLQVLAKARADLVEALGTEAKAETRVEIGTEATTAQRMDREHAADVALKQRVVDFNAAARKADDDCAAALRSVQAFKPSVLSNLLVGAYRLNGPNLDLLGQAAERVRRVPVLSIPGSEVPDDLPTGTRVRYWWDGKQYVPDPADPKTLISVESLARRDRPVRWLGVLAPEEFESGVTKLGKVGGKLLPGIGFALVFASNFFERDEELREERPDMSTGDRIKEDVSTTIRVGIPAVAGSLLFASVAETLAVAAAGGEEGVGFLAGGPVGAVAVAPVAAGGILLAGVAGGAFGEIAGEDLGKFLDKDREEEVDEDADHLPAYDREPTPRHVPEPTPSPSPGPVPTPVP